VFYYFNWSIQRCVIIQETPANPLLPVAHHDALCSNLFSVSHSVASSAPTAALTPVPPLYQHKIRQIIIAWWQKIKPSKRALSKYQM
jgi:hypothetical protein